VTVTIILRGEAYIRAPSGGSQLVPAGACDCHVHVFGPAARFPYAARRTYTPPDASLEQLQALHQRLGIERVVVIQPSPYGTDNSCTLDAVKRLGNRARAVVVVDERTSLKGASGVRVNLPTGGIPDPVAAQRLLDDAAARIGPGMHVQVFTNLKLLRQVKRLPPRLVIDHFGSPRDEADAAFLVSLVKAGAYVKLSGPHRCGVDPGALVRRLLAASAERCVWGSDWPHPPSGARDAAQVQPFDAIDDAAALERLRGWVGDAALFRKILVDNPARLYDF
jgi:predicted TIM-barrel fold metal-dependent hydrolase